MWPWMAHLKNFIWDFNGISQTLFEFLLANINMRWQQELESRTSEQNWKVF